MKYFANYYFIKRFSSKNVECSFYCIVKRRNMCVCVFVCMRVCVYVCLCACMFVCMHVCVYACACI